MKLFNRQTGNKGEDIAAKFLESNGYKIIKRNFRTRFGEIDIICRKNNTLIFIEVKTKSSNQFGSPEEMFNSKKQQKVKNMAQVYLTTSNQNNLSCRIDLIAIILGKSGEKPTINHYENIY